MSSLAKVKMNKRFILQFPLFILCFLLISGCTEKDNPTSEGIPFVSPSLPSYKDIVDINLSYGQLGLGDARQERMGGIVKSKSGINIKHAIIRITRMTDTLHIDIGSLEYGASRIFSIGWGPIILSLDINADGVIYHIWPY